VVTSGGDMEDPEIIAKIRNGEVELFRHLVERYQQPLLSFIYSLCRDSFLTEEIGQTVFLSFYRNLHRFDEYRSAPVVAWLFTAARNLTINTMKKERRYTALAEDSDEWPDNRPGPLDRLIRREERTMFAECLQLLAEPYRTTLMESLQGWSIAEISAKEMILPGTVKSRLARAREKLIALFMAEREVTP
jgi:RNA polymerase sigma-70 factor, ECF subfamily